MNGCLSRSDDDGRASGSFVRHLPTKSLNSGDHSDGLVSVGGGRDGMRKMMRMGCMLWYGGLPSASSMAVIPSDQMSAFWS